MRLEVLGRADAARLLECPRQGLRPRRVRTQRPAAALLLELFEQLRAARYGVVCHQRGNGIAEELETLLSAPRRFLTVGMQRERRHHGDVGIDAMAERHARLALDDVVVDLAPGARLRLVDEGKCQRPQAETG